MAFLGSEKSLALDQALGDAPLSPSPWQPDLFARDLFLEDFVRDGLTLSFGGHRYRVNHRFLLRVLGQPPRAAAAVRFRQDILRELQADDELRDRAQALYRQLVVLVSMFKAPHSGARLDMALFRLDILRQVRRIVTAMVDGFSGANSGLRRLHQAGEEIRATEEHRTLAALLDYHDQAARVRVDLHLGADGQIRDLTLLELAEDRDNPFHRNLLGRAWDRLRLALRGHRLDRAEVVKRLILAVYQEIAPFLRPMVQILGHLEFYLTSLQFAERAAERHLAVCLPELGGDDLSLAGLFNPHLLVRGEAPVPNALSAPMASTTLITGPNSGGKTRLLQAVGIAQILGQAGLYVPASKARLPLVDGLFASLLHDASADQSEGRLGTELVRIRTLFESVGPRSLVILDELCSGTNPSEAEDIVSMVLALLERLGPLALASSHFLDFVRRLEATSKVIGLRFLQAEIDDADTPTYQFLPGVASSSLAAATARRLGVTSGELTELVDRHKAAPTASIHHEDP